VKDKPISSSPSVTNHTWTGAWNPIGLSSPTIHPISTNPASSEAILLPTRVTKQDESG